MERPRLTLLRVSDLRLYPFRRKEAASTALELFITFRGVFVRFLLIFVDFSLDNPSAKKEKKNGKS